MDYSENSVIKPEPNSFLRNLGAAIVLAMGWFLALLVQVIAGSALPKNRC
jgi:hypothetical protein